MWNSHKEKLCIICDIGSATVSAGLVLFTEGKKPTVLYTTKLPISISDKPDFNHLENLIYILFEKLLVLINTNAFTSAEFSHFKSKHIEHVFIVLSTPWHALKSSQVVISKKFSFTLDQDLIEESIKDEEMKFEQEALTGQFEQVKNKDIRMIEREMIAVKLNGYTTPHPYGKRASNAELSVYMSLTPQGFVTKLEDILHKHIHTKHISFHTFPLSFYGAVREMYPYEEEVLLVDISGESTDISCVRGGIIQKSITFPLGKNSAIRKVMEVFSVTEEIARSFINLSENDSAEPATKEKTLAAIEQNRDEWKKSFDSTCRELSLGADNSFFSCFVTTDQEISGMYITWIKEQAQPLGIKNVIFVDSEKEKDFIEFGKHVTPHPFIALEAIFFASR